MCKCVKTIAVRIFTSTLWPKNVNRKTGVWDGTLFDNNFILYFIVLKEITPNKGIFTSKSFGTADK